ncbi:MAG: circularly permuted type 2 ATP-grasp protein [Phascolarctobacterium sp.]|uniref:circularly permuted type 2 ATP-grasp protein n=1 Tax=Phascolarctobacterium sp. TaxID=2049039 RepID=UPI0026DCCAEA|nr:circularly permuted type 2 ATP-grasp protein [Phascolarctobacterium sp.]MDO4921613.1 circularly permuted type 2 ATP-grasp protein [Phascolarctobacterium sp.]
MQDLIKYTDNINKLLARFGVKFGIYKNNVFHEQLFPFDAIPRVITAAEFEEMERGLVQRVTALNMFLYDIYHEQKIIKDKIIPEEFVFSSKGFLPQCAGVTPPGKIYSHISGIDLVQAQDKKWYILEDNLRIPSGASYPLIARKLCRIASPQTYASHNVVDNRNYGTMLSGVMKNVSTGGISVILTPGRYNAAFFEHAYLAEMTHSILAMPSDLYVENSQVYYRAMDKPQRVGAIYRRISDEYLDPLTFLPESLIGVPNLMAAYRAGNVAIINAPGNGVADDKGIYYFVPAMIKYYLGEDSITHNAPTYLMYYQKDRDYALANFDKLVFKDVSEAGGYGVLFGRDLDAKKKADFIDLIKAEPRRFIAQEIIDFIDLPIMDNGQEVLRKADLRAFVLSGKETKVWPSGLTRFSRNPDSFVVNSSQGGGFKDTWVLSR